MRLTIVVSTDVADGAEAEVKTEIVRNFIADKPDIKMAASTSSQIEPPST